MPDHGRPPMAAHGTEPTVVPFHWKGQIGDSSRKQGLCKPERFRANLAGQLIDSDAGIRSTGGVAAGRI